MTDFIHEQPTENHAAAPEAAKSGGRQKRVYLYIVVLFTAAFFLILWSFLANHRSNQMVLSELKSNATLLQSTIEENRTLNEQVKAFELQAKTLEGQLADAQQDNAELQTGMDNALRCYQALVRLESLRALCLANRLDEAAAFLAELEEEAPGELENSLTVITGQMSSEELSLFDPLRVYQTLSEQLQKR